MQSSSICYLQIIPKELPNYGALATVLFILLQQAAMVLRQKFSGGRYEENKRETNADEEKRKNKTN